MRAIVAWEFRGSARYAAALRLANDARHERIARYKCQSQRCCCPSKKLEADGDLEHPARSARAIKRQLDRTKYTHFV